MWRPSFVYNEQRLSANIKTVPDEVQLSTLDAFKCQLYSRHAFSWWKVDTLVHALSAMKAPVDFVCVQCPSGADHRAGYSPKHHKVWLCGNLVWNPYEFRRLLAHELVYRKFSI